MPRVSRWFIRASLVYLALGFTLGAVLLCNKGMPFSAALAGLLPAHIEFLLVGWVIQLVMGVATWIFPRFGVRRAPREREAVTPAVLISEATGLGDGGGWRRPNMCPTLVGHAQTQRECR